MRISKFSKVALVFVCVALVATAALILAPTFSNKSDGPADAAITAASSFDKFSNGTKYYYTNPTANSQSTVTVNSSSAWGSQANPYVINNTAQWVLFVNKINANDPAFNSKFFVLGSDLDFNNNSINPVGSSSSGFSGTLYGNKHTIKRAKIASTLDPITKADRNTGLFAYLNGASVYDLIIDSSNVYSYAENNPFFAGTLAGRARNATITNVISKANITINNNGITTTNKYLHVGGLVGYEAGSAIKIYKSTYQGTITVTPWATTLTAGIGNDCHIVGGLVGSGSSALTSVVIANCYANMHAVFHGGGVNIAGVIGRLNSLNAVVNMTDCVVVTNYTLDCASTSPDIATIANLGTSGTLPTSCVFKNIYITWNSSTAPKVELVPGWNAAGAEAATSRSGIVTNLSSITNATVNSNPMSAAAGNSGITTYYTISGSTATSKLNVTGNINYDLGGVQDCKQS